LLLFVVVEETYCQTSTVIQFTYWLVAWLGTGKSFDPCREPTRPTIIADPSVTRFRLCCWLELCLVSAGEMGGFIGLLLGASVLTIFEIIDLFVYNTFAKYCCRRVAPKTNKNAWASGPPA